jgi:hypothetical protein
LWHAAPIKCPHPKNVGISAKNAMAPEMSSNPVHNITIEWAIQPSETSIFNHHQQKHEDNYNEFVFISGFFRNITKMTLRNVRLVNDRRHNRPDLRYPHLKKLIVKECNTFCFVLLSDAN